MHPPTVCAHVGVSNALTAGACSRRSPPPPAAAATARHCRRCRPRLQPAEHWPQACATLLSPSTFSFSDAASGLPAFPESCPSPDPSNTRAPAAAPHDCMPTSGRSSPALCSAACQPEQPSKRHGEQVWAAAGAPRLVPRRATCRAADARAPPPAEAPSPQAKPHATGLHLTRSTGRPGEGRRAAAGHSQLGRGVVGTIASKAHNCCARCAGGLLRQICLFSRALRPLPHFHHAYTSVPSTPGERSRPAREFATRAPGALAATARQGRAQPLRLRSGTTARAAAAERAPPRWQAGRGPRMPQLPLARGTCLPPPPAAAGRRHHGSLQLPVHLGMDAHRGRGRRGHRAGVVRGCGGGTAQGAASRPSP